MKAGGTSRGSYHDVTTMSNLAGGCALLGVERGVLQLISPEDVYSCASSIEVILDIPGWTIID